MVTFNFPLGASFGRTVASALCAFATLALAGCGGGPKAAKVTGRVYNRDQPYPGVTVCFFPDSPGGQAAESVAGPDGSFSLRTHKEDGRVIDGVIPGRFKVGIRRQVKGDVKGDNPALLKYTSPKTTPLTVDVPPEGLTDYEIRLK